MKTGILFGPVDFRMKTDFGKTGIQEYYLAQ